MKKKTNRRGEGGEAFSQRFSRFLLRYDRLTIRATNLKEQDPNARRCQPTSVGGIVDSASSKNFLPTYLVTCLHSVHFVRRESCVGRQERKKKKNKTKRTRTKRANRSERIVRAFRESARSQSTRARARLLRNRSQEQILATTEASTQFTSFPRLTQFAFGN